jgi:hypothetical protein
MNPLVFYLVYLASLAVPAFLAFWIRERVLPEHKPMLFYLWALLAIEISQTFMDLGSPVRQVSENLHYLVEMLMVIWIAWRWKTFDRVPSIVPVLVVLVCLMWVFEKLWFGLDATLSRCRVAFSFLSALLAISILGRTMVGRSGRLARNPVFLFSLGLALYYTLHAIAELFLFTGGFKSDQMLEPVFYYSVTIGTITNIIYLRALLCLPTRASFSFR